VQSDELLRRLALNDETTVHSAIDDTAHPLCGPSSLGAKTGALVRLAALLSVGAAAVSCRATVDRARAAGATDNELVEVLVAVGPAIGAARVVNAAPHLALALDLPDLDALGEGGG
jgi:4-carboxymuconolactone decarboxylase